MIDHFFVPPEVVMGEVGLVCGVQAMVALAWVYQRNQVWYGRSEEVSGLAWVVGLAWWVFPDYSLGAEFLLSEADMRQGRVRAMVEGRSLKRVFLCEGGYRVYAY